MYRRCSKTGSRLAGDSSYGRKRTFQVRDGKSNGSRAALDRLLDPENTSVTLSTVERAATVVGRRLSIDLIDAA